MVPRVRGASWASVHRAVPVSEAPVAWGWPRPHSTEERVCDPERGRQVTLRGLHERLVVASPGRPPGAG